MYHQFSCTLCNRAICSPPLLPSLAAALEHSVRSHNIPWEYVPLSLSDADRAASASQQRRWTFPPKQTAALGLSHPDYLWGIQVPPGHSDDLYYIFALFASHLACWQAYLNVVDLLKRHRLLPLCGLLGEQHGLSSLCFLSAQSGYEPPVEVQQQIWCSIHRFQGIFLPLSPGLFLTYVTRLAYEAEQAERDHPQAFWIEKDLHDGRTFVDIPARQDAARLLNQ